MWLVELLPIEDLWLGRSDHDHALRCGTDDLFLLRKENFFVLLRISLQEQMLGVCDRSVWSPPCCLHV